MFDKELLSRASAYVEALEQKRVESKTDAERRCYEIKLKNARGVAWCAAAWDLLRVQRTLSETPDSKEKDKA